MFEQKQDLYANFNFDAKIQNLLFKLNLGPVQMLKEQQKPRCFHYTMRS